MAVSVWNGRIAPLFDSSERFLLVEGSESQAFPGETKTFAGSTSIEKASCLFDHGVSTVLCGAISGEYQRALSDRGIETVAFLAGSVQTVLAAWIRGPEGLKSLSMPGCCCRRRGRRGRCLNEASRPKAGEPEQSSCAKE